MDEILALGGSAEELTAECRNHLETCEACQAFLEESLALNLALEEPIPFPPANLAEQVMERIAFSEAEEPSLPWAERLAWVASGAIAMFCLERIPEYSSDWFSSFEAMFAQAEWVMKMPFALSASSLVLAAVVLFLVQGALIYGTRAKAS
jgi:hypothetical protein